MGRTMVIRHGAGEAAPLDSSSQIPAALGAMPGEPTWYRWHGERVHYRLLGNGEPVILVHSPDVGACCLEWRQNVESLARQYTVHAVDLPGFGISDVHAGAYRAEYYIRFLTDFIRDVIGRPARAIGSLLGASYLVHVTDRSPKLIDRLMLVVPAGISAMRPNPLGPMAFSLLGLPGLSGAVANSATSRFAIVEHLQHDVYLEPTNAGSQTLDARHWVCHRPNAGYVERSRVAGLLNVSIRGVIPRLTCPVLGVWGRHSGTPPVTDLETFLELCPAAKQVVFERSARAPHEEEPGRFNTLAGDFMAM